MPMTPSNSDDDSESNSSDDDSKNDSRDDDDDDTLLYSFRGRVWHSHEDFLNVPGARLCFVACRGDRRCRRRIVVRQADGKTKDVGHFIWFHEARFSEEGKELVARWKHAVAEHCVEKVAKHCGMSAASVVSYRCGSRKPNVAATVRLLSICSPPPKKKKRRHNA